MGLFEKVNAVLKSYGKTLTWLALEMDMTREGFTASLKGEALKFRDLIKMAQILHVKPEYFTSESTDKSSISQTGGKGNFAAQNSNFFSDQEIGYGQKKSSPELEQLQAENKKLQQDLRECNKQLVSCQQELITVLKSKKK